MRCCDKAVENKGPFRRLKTLFTKYFAAPSEWRQYLRDVMVGLSITLGAANGLIGS